MATPSLGYAIGLNVKRKDIFKEAGENLSKNLDRLVEQQDKAKKEKKDKEARILEKLMSLGEGTLHRRYESAKADAYNSMSDEVYSLLDRGGEESAIMKRMIEYGQLYNTLKYNSDNLTADETNFYRNTGYVKPRAADILFGGNTALTEDQRLELEATGYVPLPTGGFLSSPVQAKPVAKTLSENKIDENFLIAQMATDSAEKAKWDKQEKEKAKKDNTYKPVPYEQALTETTYKQKKIPGYEPIAGTVLQPGQTFFISNIVNKVINDESVVENALIEYEKTGKSLAGALRDRRTRYPDINLDQAKAMVARDFIAENYYDSWAKENAQFMQSNKTPRATGSGDDKKKELPEIFNNAHLTTEGMQKANADGVEYDTAVNMEKYKPYIAGSGPTVSITPSVNEPLKINIKGEDVNINPNKLWVDSSGKYHVIYDQAMSAASTAIAYEYGDEILSQSDMQTLLELPRAKKALDALREKADAYGYPTPERYAGKTSAAGGSGGRATVPGFPTTGN
jgi:hypothetical protein